VWVAAIGSKAIEAKDNRDAKLTVLVTASSSRNPVNRFTPQIQMIKYNSQTERATNRSEQEDDESHDKQRIVRDERLCYDY